MKIPRLVEIPQHMSIFLFGPRQTGKSTLIKSFIENKPYWEVNLLLNRNFLKYHSEPSLFYSEAQFQIKEQGVKIIFVDEVQKIPMLLDEIHALIEEHKIQFILSGSSARKLKRVHANLLGGRSLIFSIFPFTYSELKTKFHLNFALQYGLIPGIYFSKKEIIQRQLMTYVATYLKEEIAVEGLVRNLGNFHRFLDLAAQYATEILNYDNISRESAVPSKTVKGYFEILVDTLIGYFLPPWELSIKKQLSKHPKFYFFDNGVTGALTHTLSSQLSPDLRGKRFEQWLLNEIRALIEYYNLEVQLHYWRTQAGTEVDLILSKNSIPFAAIEFKAKKKILKKDLNALNSFKEEFPNLPYYICVAETDMPSISEGISIIPWKYFLDHQIKNILKINI